MNALHLYIGQAHIPLIVRKSNIIKVESCQIR